MDGVVMQSKKITGTPPQNFYTSASVQTKACMK